MAMCTPEGGLEPLFGAAEVLDVGMGSYGMVFKAKWRQLPCAVKSLHHTMFSTSDSGTSKLVARFKQECELISMIKHPYIIQFMGSVIDTVSQQPTVLIELMDESLTRFLEWSTDSLPYHTQLNFCDDMALALAYLHSNDIIHRDLSSNNLLLVGEGSRAKIANFDMSKLEGMNPRMSTGMVAYMPPEAFITPPEVFITPPCYPNKLDLWSFGVLVMQIATRQFPNPTDATTTVEDPPTGIMYMLVPERERCKGIELVDTNHPLLPLILQCLKDRGKERPSANELFGRLATLKSEPSYASLLLQALQQENETKASKLERFRANEMELTARLGECEEELKAKGHTVEQQAALRADCENNQPAIKQLHKQLESETAEHEATITQLLEQLHQEFSARQEQLMSELKSQRESAIKQVIAHENSLPELEFLTECMEIKWETGIEENKAKMKHDSLQSFAITFDPVDTLHSPTVKFKHKGKRPSMVYDPVGVTITSNGDPDMYSPVYVVDFPWTSMKDLEIVTCTTILIRATRRETFFCTSETSSEISMFRKAERGLAWKNIRLRPLLLLYDDYTPESSLFEPPLSQDILLQDTAALLIALSYLSAHDYICYRDIVLFSISLCLVLQCVQLVLHLNLLLLLAGDIETNPGPVESTSLAEYQDLVTIPNIDHKWKQIGIALGIDSPSLNAIAAKNLPPAKSKREMFRLVTKKGATWRDLIIALSDVGLKSVISDISSLYEISLNGLSRYVNSDSATKELPIVHADSATALPTKEIKSASASNEFKTFQSMYDDFLAEFSLNPIMVANAVFSKGIITQEDLHALRVIATNEGKAKQLVSLVEKTITEHPFKFDSFVGALRSVSTHVVMAEKILSLYRFNLIWSKVKKVSESELDLNYLSAELNNSQLITDAIRLKAAGAANGVEMCALFLTELQPKNLAKPFLDMLDSFRNTKLISSMLRESVASDTTVAKSPLSARPFHASLTQKPVTDFEPQGAKKPLSDVEADKIKKPTKTSSPSSTTTEKAKKPTAKVKKSETPLSEAQVLSTEAEDDLSILSPVRKDKSFPIIKEDPALSKPFTDKRSRHTSLSSVHSDEKIPSRTVSPKPAGGRESVPPPDGDSDSYQSAHSQAFSLEGNSSSREFLSSETVTTADLPDQFLSPQTDVSPSKSKKATGSSVAKAKHVRKDRPKKEYQNDKLEEALKSWDVARVDSLLTTGVADVDHVFQDGRTALMLAAIEGNKDMVNTLVRHKATVDTLDFDGQSALFHAVRIGNYEAMKILVGQPRADINIKNRCGVPMLFEPAVRGFSMITEYLVEHGAKVNVEGEEGETPLYIACKHGNKEVVKILLDNNADVTRQCKKTQRTPLQEAVEGDDPEIVRLLMKAEAKISRKSLELFTCKTRDGIKSLVHSGAKVDTRDSDQATPLIAHARQDHLDIIKELLRLRANVDLQDSKGYSALIIAAEVGNLEMVQVLVANGAILDLKERKNGYTALMFGIVHIHVGVVKELVLAKANVNIRNRDGKSSLDLARECGNTDILDALQAAPTVSVAGDPFVDLLSKYMSQRGRIKKQNGSRSPALSVRSNLSITSGSTYQASSVPEEDSAHSTEVKKLQKRIADLETRIHDLTILGTMEIADESDLTYMERTRLEAEFRKLKESKKKAEQYAVEAKQTAQRLSAENFKLKEDFNKERHYNELTRKNIMRDVELDIERSVRFDRMERVRNDVFQAEVAAKAFQMVQDRDKEGLQYESVIFTGVQLKAVIMEQTIQLDLLHLVVAGLPGSGKSTLLKSLFNVGARSTLGINQYEAILHRNPLREEDETWMEGSKLQAEVHTILMALAHFFAKQRQLPILEAQAVKIGTVFEDPEVQNYFETTHECLRKMLVGFETKSSVERVLTGSLSLINVFDIGVNKAVYEFMMAVGGQNRNLLLINVLNIFKSNRESLLDPLDLTDREYKGRYTENQASMYSDHSALHHFVHRMEAAALCLDPHTAVEDTASDKHGTKSASSVHSRSKNTDAGSHSESASSTHSHSKNTNAGTRAESASLSNSHSKNPNTIIVGTHADKFVTEAECFERRKEVMDLIKAYSDEMCVPDSAYHPFMFSVDATNPEACKSVKRAIVELMDQNKSSFKIDLPVRYVFLRYVLYSTKHIIMPREKLVEYAQKCGITGEREITSFLDIFRDCGSIISSPYHWEFLYNYVILLPIDFLRDLDKLFCVSNNDSVPNEFSTPTKYGIVSKDLVRSLWQGSFSSVQSLSDLYVKVLQNVGLLFMLGDKYFAPSLRLQHDLAPVKSSSLVILTDVSLAPFSMKQCQFVRYLTSQYKEDISLNEDCPYYNSLVFSWKKDSQEADISIRFFHNYIEVSVKPRNSAASENLSAIYSHLKTDCIAIMNRICARKNSKYYFAIVCPYSRGNVKSQHFVKFDILDSKVHELKCLYCEGGAMISGKEEMEWVRAAYKGSWKAAVHRDDLVNPTNLVHLCKELQDLTMKNIETLHQNLQPKEEKEKKKLFDTASLDKPEVLFRVLYQWHIRNPQATMKHLAKHMMDSGLHSQALKLDPSLYSNALASSAEQSTNFSSKEIFTIASSWPSRWEDLANIVQINPSEIPADQGKSSACTAVLKKWLATTEGDRRGQLAKLFEDKGYPSLSDVVCDLPISSSEG